MPSLNATGPPPTLRQACVPLSILLSYDLTWGLVVRQSHATSVTLLSYQLC